MYVQDAKLQKNVDMLYVFMWIFFECFCSNFVNLYFLL